MNVWLFAPSASVHTPYWLSLLSGRGTEVRLFSLSSESAPVDRRRLLRLAIKARTSGAPDVSVVHTLGTHGLLGALAPRARRMVLVPWGSEVEALRSSPMRRRVAQFILSRADLIVTTSSGTRDVLAGTFTGLPPMSVVSWGVDLTSLHSVDREEARAGIREQLGLCPQTTLIVSPRGLTTTYRSTEIEAAAAGAAALRPDLHLVTIDSSESPGTLGDAVRLQGWHTRLPHLTKPDLHRLLRASDVVVSVPVTDQRSTTVLEALAAGTQVILNDLPAYREIAQDGAKCWILDDFSVAALSDALLDAHPAWLRENEAWARETEDAEHRSSELQELCIGGVECA